MFSLHDLRKQLLSIRNPSLLERLMMMMPGMGEMRKMMDNPNIMKALNRQIGVIDSMTVGERRNPKTINLARRKRIARGAGVPVSMVNDLIGMFDSMAPIVTGIQNDGFEDNE